MLREVMDVLFIEVAEQTTALTKLEPRFRDRLLVGAGNVATVGIQAEQLRVRITEDEHSIVLDHIGECRMVVINIDIAEAVINELFVDRFIEP